MLGQATQIITIYPEYEREKASSDISFQLV
jgi:hypothetical protein